MKYLLMLFLCFSTLPLMAVLNEEKIVKYLQENIDKSSYQATHSHNQEHKIYYNGYMDALSEILYLIKVDEKNLFH